MLPGSTRAFADAAVPVRRWQRVQWQYDAETNGAVSSKRTAPHPHEPVRTESITEETYRAHERPSREASDVSRASVYSVQPLKGGS
jgi:hypothetical protein